MLPPTERSTNKPYGGLWESNSIPVLFSPVLSLTLHPYTVFQLYMAPLSTGNDKLSVDGRSICTTGDVDKAEW